MRSKAFLLFCVFLSSLSTFTFAAKPTPVRIAQFAEVRITLDGNFTLADVQALTKAPGSDLDISEDGCTVKVQISGRDAQDLITEGINVEILRQFFMAQSVANNLSSQNIEMANVFTEAEPLAYGESDYDAEIVSAYPEYASSPISFEEWPALTVTTIDVYYEVWPYPYSYYLYLDITDSDYENYYTLLDEYSHTGGRISDQVEGISWFHDRPLNQIWVLWASEYFPNPADPGYIDYWWIKIYFNPPAGYCSAQSLDCGFEYIDEVQVGTINNSSGCISYSDYTHISTDMEIATAYPITVTGENTWATDTVGIWIDWNQDEDFYDANEEIAVSGNPGFGPYTATITPPPAALTGNTRMRIRIADSDYDPMLNPCGPTQYGEVEDYTINVTSGSSTIKLGGYVKTGGGSPIPNIEVTADLAGSDITGGTGYYEIEVDAPYSGEVGVTNPPQDWSFTYPYLLFNQTTDRLDLDFTGTYTGPNSITVRGYITASDGGGIYNALVEANTGQSTYCDYDGFYELVVSVGDPVPAPWSGTITPAKDYWDFDPVSQSYSNLAADIDDQNFVGTYVADPTPTISGYVKTAQGQPVKDVQIAADFLGGSAMTDADGYYELTLFSEKISPRPFDGNVTPFKTDYSFNPPYNVYTSLAYDITDQNYVAAYTGLGCGNGWVEKWISRYNGDDIDILADWVSDMAVDSSGNIYVAGRSNNYQTELDCVLIKYDPNGRQVWVARYDNGDYDIAEALTIDHLGNVYVTGKTEIHDTYGTHTDCITLRYSPDSNIPQWIARYDGPDHESDGGVDIAVDDSGFIYVACYSNDSTVYSDIVVIKYSPDTNVPIWTTRYDGPDGKSDSPETMTCDENGNVYVTGTSRYNTTMNDYVIIKYSPDGNELWANTYNGSNNNSDEPADIVVDRNGNVYVTGFTSEAATNHSATTLKYNSAGNIIWTAKHSAGFVDYANAMTLDGYGNLYVAGEGVTSVDYDVFLIKYDTDSNQPLWVANYDSLGGERDCAEDIAVDKFGNIYVVGATNITPSITSADFLTLKYSPDSNQPLWSAIYSGPPGSLESAYKVVIDNVGDVIVAGYNEAFVTVKYDQCCQDGDINCDRSCDYKDLGYLCDEWLMQNVISDIAPSGGDYYVDFFDWAVFSYAWQSQLGQQNFNTACDLMADGVIDEYDLLIIMDEWLKFGDKPLFADIYPQPNGDGIINIYDFALFAQRWMDN